VPSVLLVNGPNLDLLGVREPEIYGSETLADIEARVVALGVELGVDVECVQRGGEGEIIEQIHRARTMDGIVLNAAGYTHYSYALRDAIAAVEVPCIEVHISNVHAREEFRHTSVISAVAAGIIVGCGTLGYELALRACVARIDEGWRLKH
jgi:3-dehydroquinate dehydratase II